MWPGQREAVPAYIIAPAPRNGTGRHGHQLFRVMDAPHRGQFPEYAAQVVPQRE